MREVEILALDNQEEILNLSNQIIELFVKDVFNKNNINLEEAKKRIPVEKRKVLKETFRQLKDQVDAYISKMETTNKTKETEGEK